MSTQAWSKKDADDRTADEVEYERHGNEFTFHPKRGASPNLIVRQQNSNVSGKRTTDSAALVSQLKTLSNEMHTESDENGEK